MFLAIYKLFRMALQTLRGSETPRQLAIGIALGMMIGLLPKDNLLVVVLGAIVLATNTNVLMASLSAFAFTWVGFTLEPVSHRVGHYLLTHDRLVPTWTQLYEMPVVPWTAFNDTIVCGSLAIGLLSALPVYQLGRLLFTHVTPRIHGKLVRVAAYRMLAGEDREQEPAKQNRFVRWSWVIPRLSIVVILVGAFWLLQNRAIEYSIEYFGSQMLGARLDVGRVKSSLSDGEMRLHEVDIANPNEPMRNMLHASYAGFNLDTTALLQKKFVIQQTKLAGIEFNTQRQTSGRLPDSPENPQSADDEPGFVTNAARDLGKRWAGDMKDVLENKLEENLQTVQVSKKLMDYWPREYELAGQRAQGLEKRVRELKKLKELKLDNPLRDLEKYQNALVEINQTKTELATLHNQLKKMRTAFDSDRMALINAKNVDQQNIRSLVKETKLDGDTLTDMLLGQQQGERARQILEWVRWVRETVPNPEDDFHPVRGRGTEIIFPGIKQTPDFLVEKVVLSGKGTIADDLYQFRGTMTNLTSDPKLHGLPTVINLTTIANNDVRVRAIVDQTGSERIDTLFIHIPQLDMKPQQLGSADSMMVSMGPARSELQVKLKLIGEKIVGRVTLRQHDVSLNVDKLPGGISDPQIVSSLDQQLSGIDKFDVTMLLSGSIDKPKLKFESDLGPQLAGVMNTTLKQTVDHQVASLTGRIDRLASEKMSELNLIVAQKQAEVQHLLNSHGVNLADLQGSIKQVMDFPLLRR